MISSLSPSSSSSLLPLGFLDLGLDIGEQSGVVRDAVIVNVIGGVEGEVQEAERRGLVQPHGLLAHDLQVGKVDQV
jgi:hypothetical protein